MNHSYDELIRHISRLEGQLASVKRELQSGAPDCERASTTLSAASRSFASLRRFFFKCVLEEYYLGKPLSAKRAKEYESLLQVISS